MSRMEMATLVRSLNMMKCSSDFDMDIVKTMPLYGKKTFFWELQCIDSVMSDGVQRAMACEFDIGHSSFSYTNGGSNNCVIPHSKWKLTFDQVDFEPAITVEKVTPTDKVLYYKMSIKAMKSQKEESDVISFPNANLFYEANEAKCQGGDHRKFALHKQLDYGCSYTSWFKDVLIGDSTGNSLLLKVDFEACESVSTYPSSN